MNIFKTSETSKTKKTALSNDWTLITHENCSVYISIDNPNKFSIHDWDDDEMLILITEDSSVEIQTNRYDLRHKVNLLNRSITLFAEPNEEE